MGELLVGCFALVGLAVVIASAVAFWAGLTSRPTAEAIRQIESVAAEAKAALRRLTK